jgi:ElaB/YqjD/DUF883 family membrane-anchored ribosome-binding protein
MARNKRNIIHISQVVAILCALAPLPAAGQTPAPAGQAPERSRTEGLKETDRFIKAGESTSESVATAQSEVQKTLTAYNTLVTQPSKNMKSDYKKLLKSMDSMNKKVEEATTKIAAMQNAADTYFQGRGDTIKNIQDQPLQKQAQQRLQQNQSEFSGVLDSLRAAGGALEPFRKQLADQITFLGSDLNPSATASLKPQADKLNAEGAKVFAKTEQAIAKANDYFKGLKGQS